ncbi:MAG: acyl carrier protein [Bacteroidales bacterium]
MSNLDKYNLIFGEVFSISENLINDQFTNESAENWDSIRHLSLITAIEDSFDIMLDTEDILGFTSYLIGKHILMEKYKINF